MTRRRVLSIAGVALLLLTLATPAQAAPAHAAMPPGALPGSFIPLGSPALSSSGSPLGVGGSAGPNGSAQPSVVGVLVSPAGCVGITDYPHPSNGQYATNSGPMVSVHGRTKCNSAVTTVTAKSEVWKKVWRGYQRMMTGKVSSRNNSKTSYDSAPHYRCVGQGRQWWVGITNHSSLEGGRLYTTRTIEEGTSEKSNFQCHD